MRLPIKPGDRKTMTLPHSEVCMHMRVAGKPMRVELLNDARCVQLYDMNDKPFSAPILACEAGIFTDETGHYYYP